MWGSDWETGFERRVAEVRSGLRPASLDSTGITLGGEAKEILPVALRRVQETRQDLSDYVLAAEKILETTFYAEGFLILADADTSWHGIPEPMRGSEVFSPGEAARYFGTDHAILGILTDASLGDNIRGLGSSSGWFAVTLNHPQNFRSFRETVLHEFGHSLGLKHCENPSCVMAEKERRAPSDGYCERCARDIRARAKERTVQKGRR